MNDIRLYENIAELAERFPLKLRRYRAKWLYLHWHEHIELLYLLDGVGTFVVNGETVTARAGETVAVNSNSLHTFTADAELDYLCLIVSPAMLAPAGGGNVLLRSVIPADRAVRARFDAMYKAYQSKDAGASLALLGEAYLLLSHLVTHYAATLTPKAYDVRVAQMKKTTALLDYIHANYASPISAAALAKASYISESHLCRSFKSAVGMPLTQYVNRLRMGKGSCAAAQHRRRYFRRRAQRGDRGSRLFRPPVPPHGGNVPRRLPPRRGHGEVARKGDLEPLCPS